MAVVTQKDVELGNFEGSQIKGHVCFMCGGDLFNDPAHSTGGVILWSGMDGEIVLHQPCAEKLGVNLIQDARSLVTKVKRIAKLRHETPIDATYAYTKRNDEE